MKEKIIFQVQNISELGEELGYKITLFFKHEGSLLGEFEGVYTFRIPSPQIDPVHLEREAKLEFVEYVNHLAERLNRYRQKL